VSEELLTAASRKCQSPPVSYSPERALALLIDASLSKHDYSVLRQSSKEMGTDIFPTYDKVLERKKLCYPDNIDISETSVTVKLQVLLDHTAERLVSKWGCDGSSGHSEYKQSFENEGATDANMFLISLVPLRMTGTNSLFWENPRPSSTRLCRFDLRL